MLPSISSSSVRGSAARVAGVCRHVGVDEEGVRRAAEELRREPGFFRPEHWVQHELNPK